MVVYCKNHIENIDTLFGKDAEALVLNLALQILTTTLAKVNTLEVYIHMSVHRKYNSKLQPTRCNVS